MAEQSNTTDPCNETYTDQNNITPRNMKHRLETTEEANRETIQTYEEHRTSMGMVKNHTISIAKAIVDPRAEIIHKGARNA